MPKVLHKWPWFLLCALALSFDQFSKWWVSTYLFYGEPVPVLPVFSMTLYHNRGAAFSFLSNMSGWQLWLLGGIAFTVSAVVLVWMCRLKSREHFQGIALAFILAGALGNLIDRIRLGYVVDFLSFYWQQWAFPIFNMADVFITLGATMIIFHLLFFSDGDS